ncbi:3-keto-disaccharide hydrolase [Brevifollis gellanilyticus]|uniref:3-keto-alpha-glucoside-1,2-lyase/3-keto-2-hydroxy-glucal hydratase domain-containing protein n=1 Tax=Brevifollis gellanilyticus TaxID=748831 RepID=A0A512MBE4_9BACT|nr:DUF1080 domain-containing protein [Brevifollis gellanilyticus]GEP44055.1 hypothetical protein BGE01nite_33460 [Brevifollis gellanilyticus]
MKIASLSALALLTCLIISTAQEPAKPAAPAAPAKEAATERVLFDGKSLDAWETVDIGGSGTVELEGDLMIINQGDSLSGVVYKKPADLPLTNYEISLEAKRLQGVDFFCGLTFPVGDLKKCATLICGGWGGSVTGISSIDDFDAANNNTGSYQKYEDDKWYKIRLRVTPENLSVWLDDKQIVDQDITGRKVSLRPGPIESYAPLAISTYNTSAAIRNVKVKPVKP